ncbi:MAG: hypothetical protein ACRCX2_00945 [Paraclostridium sp.]
MINDEAYVDVHGIVNSKIKIIIYDMGWVGLGGILATRFLLLKLKRSTYSLQ